MTAEDEDRSRDDDERDDDETAEVEDSDEAETSDEVETSDEDANSSEEFEEPAEESPWAAKVRRAQELWDAGNNAELRKLVEELEKAPESETAARDTAAELRRRLRPDPIAIGLWLVTLAVFCFLSYWFVVR